MVIITWCSLTCWAPSAILSLLAITATETPVPPDNTNLIIGVCIPVTALLSPFMYTLQTKKIKRAISSFRWPYFER